MTKLKDTRIGWVGLFFAMLVTVAITVTITASQTNSKVQVALEHYQSQHKSHKIMSLNLVRLNQGFSQAGASPKESLRAINALIAMLEDEGYLVLHSDAVLAGPESYFFETSDYSSLIELAIERGHDIDDGVDESVEAAEQFMKMLDIG